uniref:Putative conserved plasma membrane protein n=1 Tax=Ixodes ricinus TaxID=34613 RepID=A0A131XPU4_IXORI
MDDLHSASGVVTFTSTDRVPPNAVKLSKAEAVSYQYQVVNNWKPRSDVWPITYGPLISGLAAAAGGMKLNNIFRRHYQLKTFARVATYIPIAVLPGGAALILHTAISADILIMNTKCVVCTQTKAIASQLVFGVLYPSVIAPLACLSFAVRYNTYAVPPVKTHYKHIFIDVTTTLKKKGNMLAALSAAQCIVAFLLMHGQMNSVFKMQRKLSGM